MIGEEMRLLAGTLLVFVVEVDATTLIAEAAVVVVVGGEERRGNNQDVDTSRQPKSAWRNEHNSIIQ